MPKVIPSFENQEQKLGSGHLIRSINPEDYKLLLVDFRESMQFLLDKMPDISTLVYSEGEVVSPKYIPFSSGQKIKKISFMKYEYLKLLHNCLIMLQITDNMEGKMEKLRINDKPIVSSNQKVRKSESISILPFNVDLEKMHIIETLQKYLS